MGEKKTTTQRSQTFYGAENESHIFNRDGNQHVTQVLKSIPATQVGGGDGLRFYEGEGASANHSMSRRKADLWAMQNMLSHSDSLTYQNAITKFPDANIWKDKPGYEEEFYRQYGYYPSDMPTDAEGYDIGHDAYMRQLNPPKEAVPKKKGLFDFLKR